MWNIVYLVCHEEIGSVSVCILKPDADVLVEHYKYKGEVAKIKTIPLEDIHEYL